MPDLVEGKTFLRRSEITMNHISLHKSIQVAVMVTLIFSFASMASAQFRAFGKAVPASFSETVNVSDLPGSERLFFPLVDGAVGTLDKVWAEGRAFVGNGEILGLRIHVKFNVKRAINDDCKMVASFFNHASKRMISPAGSKAKPYRSAEGNVIVVKSFSPTKDDMDYADMQLFIPYYAMNEVDARNVKSFFVSARCGETRFLSSDFVSVDPPKELRK
ncbi:MAG TPA: hypothetical protein VF596_02845 [Pyrinomonadaceae bacterium]